MRGLRNDGKGGKGGNDGKASQTVILSEAKIYPSSFDDSLPEFRAAVRITIKSTHTFPSFPPFPPFPISF
jgi:hypothetical protein